MMTVAEIVAWHQSENDRLRAVYERTGDDKALSKARWHCEAMQVIDRMGGAR